jgi:hypothetical protein
MFVTESTAILLLQAKKKKDEGSICPLPKELSCA